MNADKRPADARREEAKSEGFCNIVEYRQEKQVLLHRSKNMEKRFTLATVQLDATPAPPPERLSRAEKLVGKAAQAGAQLVVLPELFNTGYAYRLENFSLSEYAGGPTALWMKQTSAKWGIHLAGSLLLRDGDNIYNTLLLFAPDGRSWRYDKNYPWGWERGYFRGKRSISIANTDLGAIGMLICWDIAHADLWRQYAGKVDLMLACSCPPNMPDCTYVFLDGTQVSSAQLGKTMADMRQSARQIYMDTPAQQTAWLGVPFIGSTACGTVFTAIPNPVGSFLGFLPFAPRMFRYLKHFRHIKVKATMVEAGNIFGSDGQLLAGLHNDQGEDFVLAEVNLPSEPPQPGAPQPRPPVPWMVYFTSDIFLTTVSKGTYASRPAFC